MFLKHKMINWEKYFECYDFLDINNFIKALNIPSFALNTLKGRTGYFSSNCYKILYKKINNNCS